jgi:hypothetical protein
MAKRPSTSRTSTPAAPAHHDHAHAAPAGDGASAMDYPAHEAMYHRFTGLVKWGIIGSVVLVLFLFIVIHPMVTTAT